MRLLTALLMLLLAGSAAATDFVWDGSGGDSNWSTNANWTGAGSNPNGNTDTATFQGSTRPGPVLDGNRTVNQLTFATATAFTLSAASNQVLTFQANGATLPALNDVLGSHTISCNLTLNDDTTIYVTSGATLTISGSIGGSGRLIKAGSGILLLKPAVTASANSYSGGTYVSGGTLKLDSTNFAALPAGNVQVDATMDIAGFATAITGSLSGSGAITTTGGSATLTVNAASACTYAGSLVDGPSSKVLSLTKSGAGELTLTGSGSTFTGAVSVSAGTLTAAANAALGASGGGTAISAGATLKLSGGVTLGDTVTILNSAGAAGTLLSASGANSLSSSPVITTVASSFYPVIQCDAGSLSLPGVTKTGSPIGLQMQGSGNISVAGTLDLAGTGGLSKLGTGTLTVAGANYGSFALYGGTFAFSSASALGSAALGIYGGVLAPSGSFTVALPILAGADFTIAPTASPVTFSGAIDLNAASRTITIDDGTGTARIVAFTGAISNGSLTKAGADELDLGGAGSNTFSALAVTGGALKTTTASRLPAVAAQVDAGATLNLNGFAATLAGISGSGSIALGSATLTDSATSTFAGAVTGSGSLSISAGTLTLTGDQGTLLGAGTITINSGAALAVDNTGTANPDRLSDSVNLQLNGGSFSITAPASNGRSETIGKITLLASSSIQVVSTGNGDCTLTASDGTNGFVPGAFALTFTRTDGSGGGKAAFFILHGYVDNSAVASATVNGSAATYTITQGLIGSTASWYSGSVGEWSTISWYSDNARTALLSGYPNSNSANVHIDRAVSVASSYNCAQLDMQAGGVLTGTATNSYVNISNGSSGLLQATGSAGTRSIVHLGVYSNSQPMTFDIGTGITLTIDGNDWDGSSYHVLFLNDLTKIGGGTLDLQVPTWPGYNGNTTCSNGVLRLNYFNPGPLGPSSYVGYVRPTTSALIANAGGGNTGIIELNVNHTTPSITGAGIIRSYAGSTGTVTLTTTSGGSFPGNLADGAGGHPLALLVNNGSSGNLALSGINTFTGGTTVSAGTLTVSGGQALDDGSPVTLSGGNLTVLNTETIGGLAETAPTTVTVQGATTLTATGTASFAANWTLTGGGTLALTGGGSGSTSGQPTISGATLSIRQANHIGTATAVHLSAGTLSVANTIASFGATIDLTGSGTVDVAGGASLTTTASITGANPLTKSGAGTWVMGSTTASQTSTTVTGGTLSISDYRQLGSTSPVANLVLAGGGLAVTADVYATTTGAVGGTARTLAINQASTFDVASGKTLTWPGTISGSGSLQKTSAGALILAGANGGFTGSVSIQSGSVRADSATALGAGPGISVADGAALQINGAYALTEPISLIGDGGGSGALQFLATAGGASLGTGQVVIASGATKPATISVAAGSVTISSAIHGNGGLNKIGAGTLVLSNTGNDFTNTLAVSAGILSSGADLALGAAANALVLNGGTFQATSPITFAATRTLQVTTAVGNTIDVGTTILTIPSLDTLVGQNLTLTSASGGALVVNTGVATNSTIAGGLSGSGALTKNGTGSLTIQSVNDGSGSTTYTGAVVVSAGVLRVNGALKDTGTVNVGASGVIAGNGSVGALTVSGTARPGGAGAAGVFTAKSLVVNTGAVLDYDLGTANDLLSVNGTASVGTGVTLNVTSFPQPGSFGNGNYPIISATSAPSLAGAMTVNYVGGTTYAGAKTVITSGNSLVLVADSASPSVAAITSTTADGTYFYQDPAINVTVQLSKPAVLTGSIQVTLNGRNGGVVVTIPSPGASLVSSLSGTYTIVNGDLSGTYSGGVLTAAGKLTATAIAFGAGGNNLTDQVGHVVSAISLPSGQNIADLKSLYVDNHVPQVDVNDSGWATTTATSVAISTGHAKLFGDVIASHVTTNDPASFSGQLHFLQATDAETTSAAQLTYTIRLDPSRGLVEYDATGAFTGGQQTVTTAGPKSTFTQADVNAGFVRYLDTGTTAGNDAFLIDVTDGNAKTSPLVLVRISMTGVPAPVVSAGFGGTWNYAEQANKPGNYVAVDSTVTVTDAGNPSPNMNGGSLSIVVQSPIAGVDELDFLPGTVSIDLSGNISLAGGPILGTIGPVGGNSLTINFTTANATPANVTALLQSLGYRNTESAPDPTLSRKIQLDLYNGQVNSSHAVVYKPITILLYNDPPTVNVPAIIPTVPGLQRTIVVSATDPEGELASNLTYQVTVLPTRGVLTYPGGALVPINTNLTGTTLIYTPLYLSLPLPTTNTVDDTFTVSAKDIDFSTTPALPTLLKNGPNFHAATGTGQYQVRISTGSGGTVPTFTAPCYMSVQPGHTHTFTPSVNSAAGAVLTYTMLNNPGVSSFNSTDGSFTWTNIPSPGGATAPYYLFQILVEDTTHGTAAVLPVMLRVDVGGPG